MSGSPIFGSSQRIPPPVCLARTSSTWARNTPSARRPGGRPAAAGGLDAPRRRGRIGQRPLCGDNAVLAFSELIRPVLVGPVFTCPVLLGPVLFGPVFVGSGAGRRGGGELHACEGPVPGRHQPGADGWPRGVLAGRP